MTSDNAKQMATQLDAIEMSVQSIRDLITGGWVPAFDPAEQAIAVQLDGIREALAALDAING